jgi:hypothetical protein
MLLIALLTILQRFSVITTIRPIYSNTTNAFMLEMQAPQDQPTMLATRYTTTPTASKPPKPSKQSDISLLNQTFVLQIPVEQLGRTS